VGLQSGIDFHLQNNGNQANLESGGQGSGAWTGQVSST
jgi:hypothetical protein